jgi:two-component system LytT family sensor kinase
MALSRVTRYPIDYMIATKVVLAASGLVASLGLRELYRRTLPSTSDSLSRLIWIPAVASYAMAILWTMFYNLADAQIATAMLDRPVTIDNLFELTSGSVYHAFALLAWSVLYVGIQRHLALAEAQLRSVRAESQANAARLQALRYQLQPHFLFNTLNALSTLIVDGRAADASRMTSRLGDYLRYTLARGDVDEVALEDEVDLARQYLEIESVRFGERLVVRFDVAPDTVRAAVPTLILQPLIENAVQHGIATRAAGGTVTVAGVREGTRLRLDVVDDGAGNVKVDPARGNGIGLGNTRERLSALYGDDQSLRISHDGGSAGTRVTIHLPFRPLPASAPDR